MITDDHIILVRFRADLVPVFAFGENDVGTPILCPCWLSGFSLTFVVSLDRCMSSVSMLCNRLPLVVGALDHTADLLISQ